MAILRSIVAGERDPDRRPAGKTAESARPGNRLRKAWKATGRAARFHKMVLRMAPSCGTCSRTNTIPMRYLDPVALKLQSYIPLPNGVATRDLTGVTPKTRALP